MNTYCNSSIDAAGNAYTLCVPPPDHEQTGPLSGLAGAKAAVGEYLHEANERIGAKLTEMAQATREVGRAVQHGIGDSFVTLGQAINGDDAAQERVGDAALDAGKTVGIVGLSGVLAGPVGAGAAIGWTAMGSPIPASVKALVQRVPTLDSIMYDAQPQFQRITFALPRSHAVTSSSAQEPAFEPGLDDPSSLIGHREPVPDDIVSKNPM